MQSYSANISQLTGVSDHKIWRVLDVYVNAAKSDEDLTDVTLLGMDETSVAKGHDYITLFVDIEKRKTLHISDGKDSKTVENFVEVLENKQLEFRPLEFLYFLFKLPLSQSLYASLKQQ